MNSIKKNYVIYGSISVAIVVLLLAWIALDARRFYISPGKNGIAYKVDRKTGKTWMIRGTSIVEVEEPEPERNLEELSRDDVKALEGRGGYSVGSLFRGSIYNPTNFHVRKVIIAVATPEGSKEEWKREFVDEVIVDPQSTGIFHFDTLDGDKAGATEWGLVRAFGYKAR